MSGKGQHAATPPSAGVALLQRMADGDRDAFSAFYDLYAGLAFALLVRILGDRAEAEEVLQETFWQLWVDAQSYDEERGSPEAWVVMRARSRGIDRLRSGRRREDRVGGSLAARGAQPAAEPPADAPGDRERVRSALDVLPPPQRKVVELAYFEGLTLSEIAARQDEPLGTIKSRMSLAMERLRKHFRAREGT